MTLRPIWSRSQLPDGFEFVSYEPVAGWTTKVAREGDQVSTVTWTADDASAAIEPGQFRDFGLSVGLPEQYAEGESLTFPSIQRYDDGETVRWIGEPDAEHPAPQVLLTAAASRARRGYRARGARDDRASGRGRAMTTTTATASRWPR